MYSPSEILQGIRNPAKTEREIARRYYQCQNGGSFNDAGLDIFEADWDNMFILDARRYDEFQQAEDWGGPRDSHIPSVCNSGVRACQFH